MTEHQMLWRAVIARALLDAAFVDELPGENGSGRRKMQRDKARHYLSRRSRDLDLVCEYAGFCPDTLIRKAHEIQTSIELIRQAGGSGAEAMRAIMQWMRGKEGAVRGLDQPEAPLSGVLAKQPARPVGPSPDDDGRPIRRTPRTARAA